MPTKTKSDLRIQTSFLKEMSSEEKDKLIRIMHHKIEQAYEIVHNLEKDKPFEELGQLLRKALES